MAWIWRSHGLDVARLDSRPCLVLIAIWAIVRAAGTSGPARIEDSPETILKRRYARGEIDREEYERLLSDLRK